MDFFFYGTLMDRDVLARVIGRHARAVRLAPAVLRGYRPVRRRGATYPVLIADGTAETQGRLFLGATGPEVARLRRFEGPEYVLRAMTATDGAGAARACHVFLPQSVALAATDEAWAFETWRRRHKSAYLAYVTTGRPM